MVSSASILCVILNILICFCIPIGIFLYLLIKKHNVIKPFFIGMGIFIVFQLLTRIPVLNMLSQKSWFLNLSSNSWIYGLFLGGTAALFETTGRFIAFKFLLKKNRTFVDGIGYGIGHGGIEAMALVGLTNINNLILMLAINSGVFQALTGSLPTSTVEMIYNQLTGISAGTFLLGGIERISVIIIQIALALLVLYAVKYKEYKYLLLSFLIHACLDAGVVILPSRFNMSMGALEVLIGILAICMLVSMYRKRKSFEM